MHAWQWWSWCFMLTLSVTQGKEIAAHEDPTKKEDSVNLNEREDIHEQHARQRRDLEWSDEEDSDVINQLHSFTKRNPFLSRWGGHRLSDFLYYKRRPAFSSWGGKRGPAFSSWGGKRSVIPSNFDNTNQQTLNNLTNPNNEYIPHSTNQNHPDYNLYTILPDKFFNEETFPNTEKSYLLNHDDLNALNYSDQKFSLPNYKLQTIQWNDNDEFEYDPRNNRDKFEENEYLNDYDDDYNSDDGTDIKATVDLDKGRLILSNIFNKRAAPSFNSWGGKRSPAFNSWGGKRSPAFNSWGGKRSPAFNSWGGKISPAFNSWGGKRVPAFNSWGGKRVPAFNSWGGKRAPSFNSWGGKRSPAFNSWGGKRAIGYHKFMDLYPEENTIDNALGELPSSNRKKRSLSYTDSDENNKTPSNILHENYQTLDILEDKRAPGLNSVGGSRTLAFNSWGGKRAPAFNSWGGKRAPAFNSWGGKRAPAFNSWGGKRAPAFNSWGGKRAPAFNSWGGKRVPAFNSWGGKRVPAFNSWGGKRSPAFNSWGGKRTPIENNLHDWRKPYEPLIDNWKERQTNDYSLDGKRGLLSNTGNGKRLPAFHSWGGKRSSNDNRIHSTSPDYHEDIIHDTIISNENNLSSLTQLQNPEAPESDHFDNDNTGSQYLPHYNKYTQLFNSNDNSVNRNEKSNIVKRSLSTGKRNPAFYSWGGKRNMFQITADEPESEFYNLEGDIPIFENEKLAPHEENPVNIRKKRNIEDNSVALITSDNLSVPGNGIRSFTEEIDPGVPNDVTVCCIKRAQYGNKNLFMQMLLKTKSFRDLSWPAIRPIRRGVDFYPWGGKRSSL